MGNYFHHWNNFRIFELNTTELTNIRIHGAKMLWRSIFSGFFILYLILQRSKLFLSKKTGKYFRFIPRQRRNKTDQYHGFTSLHVLLPNTES